MIKRHKNKSVRKRTTATAQAANILCGQNETAIDPIYVQINNSKTHLFNKNNNKSFLCSTRAIYIYNNNIYV